MKSAFFSISTLRLEISDDLSPQARSGVDLGSRSQGADHASRGPAAAEVDAQSLPRVTRVAQPARTAALPWYQGDRVSSPIDAAISSTSLRRSGDSLRMDERVPQRTAPTTSWSCRPRTFMPPATRRPTGVRAATFLGFTITTGRIICHAKLAPWSACRRSRTAARHAGRWPYVNSRITRSQPGSAGIRR